MPSKLILTALVLGLCCTMQPPIRAQSFHFEHLTASEGLTPGKVLSLLQDRQGFMWIGTTDGLNRYDGYGVTVYQHNPLDSTSLAGDVVYALYEDREGVLWVGTSGGLSRLDRTSGTFTHFLPDRDVPETPWTNDVGHLYEDRAGTFWVGTFGGGIHQMDRATGTLTSYRHDPADPASLSFNVVEALHEDAAGTLWISTINGLNRFDRETDTFTRFLYPEDSLFQGSIVDFREDAREPGVFWLSTLSGLVRFVPATGALRRVLPFPFSTSMQGGPWWSMPQGIAVDPAMPTVLWIAVPREGLYRFDTETEEATLYGHDHDDPRSLSGEPQCVYVDRAGLVWVGTTRGVDRFDPAASLFRHVVAGAQDAPPLLHNNVSALYEDRAGNLWVATGDFLAGTALTRIAHGTGAVTHWLPPPGTPAGLPDNTSINALLEDRVGALWVGTTPRKNEPALTRLDPRTGAFTHWNHDPQDSASLTPGGVTVLYEDRSGTLWVGTRSGLSRMDAASGAFVNYRHVPGDPHSLAGPEVRAILEDQAGRLWVGTNGGLSRFDASAFVNYRHDPDRSASLSGNSVFALHETAAVPGVLWASTGAVLDRFDTQTEEATHYTTRDGFPPYPIVGILEDDAGRLWMSTAGAGLLSFDPADSTVLRYDETNAVQARRFNPGAAFVSPRTGEMFFGGLNGFNTFHPRQIERPSSPPPVVFTDFKLFGRPVPPGSSSPLKRPIWETQEIHLPHDQNVLAFDFVALHYKNPAQNRYAYRLDGFDADWVQAGNRRSAAYTNLRSGRYTFRVKAANSEGRWTEQEAAVALLILPPWWRTWWAYALYGAVLIGGVVTADRLRRRQVLHAERARSLLREQELRAQAAEAWANYLQAENQRQMQELESARTLQLSLLPKSVPEHPAVEIAATMKTATEVGGDYYDFHLAEDGTLTIAVGDATGHGAQAGTMVTAAKSLFTGFADAPDLTEVLQRSAAALRRMRLPKLFMAMALARVRGRTLELAGAGMPPALVYRAASGCFEQVPLKGLPLGGPGDFAYQQQRLLLAPGDTVVLMSDGLPELFGPGGAMLGYEQAAAVFEAVAGQPPEAVVAHLMATAAAWLDGQAQNDDMTFVVLRAKEA